MGLNYILPLFVCMWSLSKFAQAWDVFIQCDFVDIIKAYEGDLYIVC